MNLLVAFTFASLSKAPFTPTVVAKSAQHFSRIS